MENFTEIVEQAQSAQFTELSGRKYRVRLIQGDVLGSSGYYPAEVLRRDGPRLFKAGTPMYLDHQLPDEKDFRPHGSVTTFAAEISEDAVYENDGLYATIEVFEHQMPLIKSLKDKIGISIRAKGKTVNQDIGGRRVPVFVELLEARSADFVVKAGAGGKIVSILESAKEEETHMEKEAIEQLLQGFDARFETMTKSMVDAIESLRPAEVEVVVEEEVEESANADARILEIAEQLGASKLDAEGKARVLDLHRANGKDIAELITAEEAYIARAEEAEESAGAEEEAEAEESAKDVAVSLPSRWNIK